ncbi:MAG TPA: DNA-processing protein DprA, partial [Gudongella oleilytica]|nr:DNA-processing protein DprA [Gudongella oleilytica]
MDGRSTLIWLNMLQIPSDKICSFINWFGDIAEINNMSDVDLRSSGIFSELQIARILDKNSIKDLTQYEKKVRIKGAEILTDFDDDYPEALKSIDDRPMILYVRGSLKKEDAVAIGIVGSRKATSYGKWACEKISGDLAGLGVTIVSGMASGIDTYAHRAALDSEGRTIAVLGCGVDVVYPQKNKTLYEEISSNGAVISEFPLGTQPLPFHFPMRNRIISGLSLGIAVIEAQEKSGSLITASYAASQGKDVFAVPGNINSLYSSGTNLLIKDGAKPLLTTEDIIEELPVLRSNSRKMFNKGHEKIPLSETEKKVLGVLQEGPLHSDIIALRTGLDISTVLGTLMILE